MRARHAFAILLGSTLACGVACSSSTPSTAEADAGTDASAGPDGASGPKQTGRILVALSEGTPVNGATITAGGASTTARADGTYEIAIPKGTPYSMTVTADEFFKFNDQEWIVKNDLLAQGDTQLLSTTVANLLASYLPARSTQNGLLVVRVFPLPPCDSEEGSTLTLEPAGIAKLTYFSGGRPNQATKATIKGEVFSGGFSDVQPNVPVTVTVSSPLCEQVPFPVDFEGKTLTGNQKTEPGDAISYVRVFIGPKKIVDAGTD